MRLGIVTCSKCSTLTTSEKPLLDLLRSEGHTAEPVVWNDSNVIWGGFDGLMIRSIWDYHLHPEAFFEWLQGLDQRQVNTWNPVNVLRWNAHKFYLRDLAAKGIVIAPTLFLKQGTQSALEQTAKLGWTDIVVKPAISASGYRTHSFSISSADAATHLSEASAHGDFLVQPYLRAIEASGEISLIYFCHTFSHAVLKRPRQGDFRVQTEYGGQSVPYEPDLLIIQQGEEILRLTGMHVLYARVEGLVKNGRLVLMGVELIEPGLFLRVRPGSVRVFADSFLQCLKPSASS